jgi:hypothetical protein
VEDFVVAHNPDGDSTLPYLVRLPLTDAGIVLKVRDTWLRTAKVYCHPSSDWPDEPEIVERVPVRSCVRRGAAIDLVLDRGRENRSQFVFARARGRKVIFWQSARTARQARPNVALPTQRASGQVLEIVASVERKSLSDLVSTMTTGKLRYLLAALAELPRAAFVVEDRYSVIFKLTCTRPAVIAEGLAEAQVRLPNVPIVFCETRPLAQEWTYRFLGAAVAHHHDDTHADLLTESLPAAGPLPAAPPSPAEIRVWAVANGLELSPKGQVPASIVAAFQTAHHER